MSHGQGLTMAKADVQRADNLTTVMRPAEHEASGFRVLAGGAFVSFEMKQVGWSDLWRMLDRGPLGDRTDVRRTLRQRDGRTPRDPDSL